MHGYTIVTRSVYDADDHLIASVTPSPEAPRLVSVTFSDYATNGKGPCEVVLPFSCLALLSDALMAAAQESSASR